MKLTRTKRLCILTFCLLGAFALRVHHLDHFSLWLDEGLTPLRSGYSIGKILVNEIDIQESISSDTHPPLYFLVVHATRRLLGTSDFAYRFPSVLFDLVLVAFIGRFASTISKKKQLPLFVVILSALNPLQIWYAQEARMYALAVLLAAIASYALWRAIQGDGAALTRWLLMYLIFAGLAFYTLYLVAFLIIGQGLIWLWLLWRNGQKRLILGGLIVGIIAAVPLVPYTIPRLFTGAETRYSLIGLQTILFDIVRGFGLGLTSTLTPQLSLIAYAIIITLLLIGASWRRQRPFLLVYLLSIAVLIAIVSLLKPMYLGVRHIMLSLPAFLLLMGLGLVRLPRFTQLPALVVVLVAPILSINSLYTSPSVAKDDYRGMVRTIEQQVGDNDIILYNNAILLPLHEHYRQTDTPFTALPIYPYRMRSPETFLNIQSIVNQYDRTWFVMDPPPDGRDPQLRVLEMYETYMILTEQRSFEALNADLRVRVYGITVLFLDSVPTDAKDLLWQGNGLPLLKGVRVDGQPAIDSHSLWLDLFWANPCGAELTCDPADNDLQFELLAPNGTPWLTEAKLFQIEPYPEDTLINQADIMQTMVGLSLPVGTPPGDYELRVRAWDAIQKTGVGDWQTLDTVTIGNVLVSAEPPTQTTGKITFENGLELHGVQFNNVKPGNPTPLTMYWYSDEPLEPLTYQLDVYKPDGQLFKSYREAVGPAWYAGEALPQSTLIAQVQKDAVYFEPEAPVGSYKLRWSLFSGDSVVGGRGDFRPIFQDNPQFGAIEVEPWPLITDLPPVDNAGDIVDSSFGEAIRLYAAEIGDSAERGGALPITLTFQATAQTTQNFKVFIHMTPVDTGDNVAQSDQIPVNFLRPTNGWREGEVIIDEHILQIPVELAAGDYDLYVGMYDPETFVRAEIVQNGKKLPDGRLKIGTLTFP